MHAGLRRIMRGQHARRLDRRLRCIVVPYGIATETGFDRADRQPARPQQTDGVAFDLDDRALDADARWSTIEDKLDLVAEIALHVLGLRGADPAGRIGARCSQRTSEGYDQFACKALGNTDADRIEPCGTQRMNGATGRKRQNQGQRPRPERLGELARKRIEHRMALRHCEVRHMRDQRIEARSALDLVDAGDRLRTGGIGRQPIDGLGRDRHRLGIFQHLAATRQRPAVFRCDVDDFGHVRLRMMKCDRLYRPGAALPSDCDVTSPGSPSAALPVWRRGAARFSMRSWGRWCGTGCRCRALSC